MLFASDSASNLRSANFRSLIFRAAPISQSTFFERKISSREFLLLFAVKPERSESLNTNK